MNCAINPCLKVYSHIVDRKLKGEHLKKGSKRRTVVRFSFQKKTNVALLRILPSSTFRRYSTIVLGKPVDCTI